MHKHTVGKAQPFTLPVTNLCNYAAYNFMAEIFIFGILEVFEFTQNYMCCVLFGPPCTQYELRLLLLNDSCYVVTRGIQVVSVVFIRWCLAAVT